MPNDNSNQPLRPAASQITAAQARKMQSDGATLIDVREAGEHAQGLAEGAVPISRGDLPTGIAAVASDPNKPLLLMCAQGQRSLLAADTLQQMGYSKVYSVTGGFADWQQQGLPWAAPNASDPAANERYARQVRLPEIGAQGQRKLAAARVAIVGVGGLGSPAALYLAAAGVGTLGLIDDDIVERSNLHRQVVHNEHTLGRAKTESARATLAALNPDIDVQTHKQKLSVDNVEAIFGGYDLILDGSDNFPTRYLVNDACCKLGLTHISAAVQGFSGQLSVFMQGGPCYRCLFPEPPPVELAPSCAEAGVLGVLPGIMGMQQALEALKIIIGFGDPLKGRLMVFDAKTSRQRVLQLARDPDCEYCSPDRDFPGYIDYKEFCGRGA